MLQFRSSMVLDNVPQAQALDDVFWMAVYNLALGGGSGDGADTRRFYDVLLPFLTGKTPRPGLQSLGHQISFPVQKASSVHPA